MTRKTYARVLTTDLPATLDVLRELVGRAPDFETHFGRFDIALIGDFCVVAGAQDALDRYLGTVGPVIVEDLDATVELVRSRGGELTVEPFEGPAGRGFLARHSDGVEFEYVQFRPDLARTVFEQAEAVAPSAAG